ncbi:MAG: DNA repair protein RecO [Chlamydiae bacterium]|nr:DNA repair protein RecO [Chlamydiota bacterium]
MTEEIHCQAIVLSSLNYRDYDCITTFYTDTHGIIKTIILGAKRAKSSKAIFCQPLTLLNLTFRPRKGDLHSFKEAKVLNANLEIRDSFDALQVGIKLLNLVSKSQAPEEPSYRVFQLLASYLKKIPEFTNPWILSSSFVLKILVLSGHWTLQSKCSKCKVSLEKFHFSSNSYYCSNCAPDASLVFEVPEVQALSQLIQEKSFQALSQLKTPPKLEKKLDLLFMMNQQ